MLALINCINHDKASFVRFTGRSKDRAELVHQVLRLLILESVIKLDHGLGKRPFPGRKLAKETCEKQSRCLYLLVSITK